MLRDAVWQLGADVLELLITAPIPPLAATAVSTSSPSAPTGYIGSRTYWLTMK